MPILGLFFWAFVAVLLISLASRLLSLLFPDPKFTGSARSVSNPDLRLETAGFGLTEAQRNSPPAPAAVFVDTVASRHVPVPGMAAHDRAVRAQEAALASLNGPPFSSGVDWKAYHAKARADALVALAAQELEGQGDPLPLASGRDGLPSSFPDVGDNPLWSDSDVGITRPWISPANGPHPTPGRFGRLRK